MAHPRGGHCAQVDLDAFGSCHAMIAAAGGALLERAIGSGAVRSDVDIRDLLGLVNALARAGGGHGRTSGDENRLLMLALTGIVTRPAG